jgi:hypothetical protein
MAATVYVSSRCTNCQRFVGALRRTDIAASTQVVDVDVTGPVRGLEYVPTVRTATGAVLSGTKAFEWLKDYEAGADLDSAGGFGGLAFSMVTDTTGALLRGDAFAPFADDN